jgi:two-component sensor histidine kinase
VTEILFGLLFLAAGAFGASLARGTAEGIRPHMLFFAAGVALVAAAATGSWPWVTIPLQIAGLVCAAVALLKVLFRPKPGENPRDDAKAVPEPPVDTGIVALLADNDKTLGELRLANRSLEDIVAERTKELADTTRRFDTALQGSQVTVFQQDTDLRYTWIYNPQPGLEPTVGHTDEEALAPEVAAQIVPIKSQVLESGERAEAEVSVRTPDGGERWFRLRVEPLDYARQVGLTSVAVDITPAKENEAHLRSTMRELTHRSRNLLAVIQGIARRTAASADNVDVFVDRFSARLQALASAHDILVDSSWKGASMRDIIDVQLAHVGEAGDRQVVVDGAPIMLRPDAAQHLSLALHELAVNAVEHGALSEPGGRVHLTWGRPDESRPEIELTWREENGPAVSEPDVSGFGRVVLDRLVPRGMDGDATLEFKPGGVSWTLRFPDSNVLAEQPSR